MSVIRVSVKWNKSQFDDVELDTSLDVACFKSQLFSLTNVAPDRQKIMSKNLWKGFLKDDAILSSLVIANGSLFTLIGSAETLQVPTSIPMFIEDMSEEKKAQVGAALPSGLVNLGNTCYLNSTLQCLRAVSELRQPLHDVMNASQDTYNPDKPLAASLLQLFETADSSTSSMAPRAFVSIFRNLHPRFAQTGQYGSYRQQDAEECFNSIITSLGTNNNSNLNEIFKCHFVTKLKCQEEPPSDMTNANIREETSDKLICNIQGGSDGTNNDVSQLISGLELSLSSSVTLYSSLLERDAIWSKVSKLVAPYPSILVVQLMRFYWKSNANSENGGVKCKIRKIVNFPFELHLTSILQHPEDRLAYDLICIVSHQGREADGGHYIAWVKSDGKWLVFDDDAVFETSEEKVMELRGGTDQHVAYLLFYRQRLT